MAQLKDTIIDGNLEIKNSGEITLETNKTVKGIHPVTNKPSQMIGISDSGNTIVGYGGYTNQNGDSYICGNDISLYVASTGNSSFHPYCKAGDTFKYSNFRTSGYVTNSGKDVTFLIPIAMPIIGSPTATATSGDGFVLRQGEKYTHGSSTSTAVKPVSYTVTPSFSSGFIVVAKFDVVTNVINNNPIGIYWDGSITLS